MRTLFLSLAMLVVAACQASPTPQQLTGAWGGEHIGLELSASGGVLEYDCAAGTIDEPLFLDGDGGFVARGTHSPGHGGPDRIDEPAPRFPAEYRGEVRGGEMTLTIRTADQVLGPFTLRRGAPANLLRCL